MKKVIFNKIKINKNYWFTAEYYENDILKYSEGCALDEKKKVQLLKNKFNALK